MELKNSALIVIDLQAGIKRIAAQAYPLSFDEVVKNNRKLIEVFAKENAPVYLVSVQPKVFPGPVRRAFGKLLLADLIHKYPKIRELIKFGPSAFSKSDYGLGRELKENGIDRLFITGVSTENGVLKTALDAHAAGFEVRIIKGATASRTADKYNQVIEKDLPAIGSFEEMSAFE